MTTRVCANGLSAQAPCLQAPCLRKRPVCKASLAAVHDGQILVTSSSPHGGRVIIFPRPPPHTRTHSHTHARQHEVWGGETKVGAGERGKTSRWAMVFPSPQFVSASCRIFFSPEGANGVWLWWCASRCRLCLAYKGMRDAVEILQPHVLHSLLLKPLPPPTKNTPNCTVDMLAERLLTQSACAALYKKEALQIVSAVNCCDEVYRPRGLTGASKRKRPLLFSLTFSRQGKKLMASSVTFWNSSPQITCRRFMSVSNSRAPSLRTTPCTPKALITWRQTSGCTKSLALSPTSQGWPASSNA